MQAPDASSHAHSTDDHSATPASHYHGCAAPPRSLFGTATTGLFVSCAVLSFRYSVFYIYPERKQIKLRETVERNA